MEFDPMAVCFDFENLDSPFWKQVFANSYLQGILYGFGERNAYFFSLREECSQQEAQIKLQDYPHLFAAQAARSPLQDEPDQKTLKDLMIPNFTCFTVPLERDSAVINFERERAMIIRELSDKDFVE